MKVRKGVGRRTKDESKPIDTPVGELGEKDTIMHYNAVMLEDLKSKMELVIEFMETVGSELKREIAQLDRKIEDLRAEMNLKFDALNFKIDKVEERLTLRIDKVAARLDDHDTRLVAIESCH
jgi:hypothetical protein